MYHNHEENIENAKLLINAIEDGLIPPNIFYKRKYLDIYQLLKSMISDAETGHALIEKLEKIIKEMQEAHKEYKYYSLDSRKLIFAEYDKLKKQGIELFAENEKMKDEIASLKQILKIKGVNIEQGIIYTTVIKF